MVAHTVILTYLPIKYFCTNQYITLYITGGSLTIWELTGGRKRQPERYAIRTHLERFASNQLPYGNAYSTQANFACGCFQLFKKHYKLYDPLLETVTVMAFSAHHPSIMSRAALSLALWKCSGGKIFKLNILTK